MVSQTENFFMDISGTEKQEKAETLGSYGSSGGQDVIMGTMRYEDALLEHGWTYLYLFTMSEVIQ